MCGEQVTVLHVSFFLLTSYSPSFISKEASVTQVLQEASSSKSHLKAVPYPAFFSASLLLIFSRKKVCRKTTMSNNIAITQVDPRISPPSLDWHGLSLAFPPGSQASPVLHSDTEAYESEIPPLMDGHTWHMVRLTKQLLAIYVFCFNIAS